MALRLNDTVSFQKDVTSSIPRNKYFTHQDFFYMFIYLSIAGRSEGCIGEVKYSCCGKLFIFLNFMMMICIPTLYPRNSKNKKPKIEKRI